MRAALRRFWHDSVNRFITRLGLGALLLGALLLTVFGLPWWAALFPLGMAVAIAGYVIWQVAGLH